MIITASQTPPKVNPTTASPALRCAAAAVQPFGPRGGNWGCDWPSTWIALIAVAVQFRMLRSVYQVAVWPRVRTGMGLCGVKGPQLHKSAERCRQRLLPVGVLATQVAHAL